MHRTSLVRALCAALALVAMAISHAAYATVCVVGPNADLPPQCFGGNGYLSPNDVHMIINGLPPGTTIQLGAEHRDFFNITRLPAPSGTLNGEQENFNSILTLHLTGTGAAAGYESFKTMQTTDQTSIAPRNPSAPFQSFNTEMNAIQGQLPPGDPDFDLLRITAGGLFGMQSLGHTTITQIAPNQWNVDSFFDITYRIDFVGHPGGPFGGMSGSTTGTIRMEAGQAFVPEPATMGLLGLGGLAVLGLARRRSRG